MEEFDPNELLNEEKINNIRVKETKHKSASVINQDLNTKNNKVIFYLKSIHQFQILKNTKI